MKIHELIAELQNFDLNLNVECLCECTDWAYNEELECSEEVDSYYQGNVSKVELWINNSSKHVVRIS